MPDVKVGSIIDYSLNIVSPVNDFSPEWNIQGVHPKLYTQFSISYPTTLMFTSITHAKSAQTEFKSEEDAIQSKDEFCHYLKYSRMKLGENYSLWVRRNVKAVIDEPYIVNLKNYTERLTIQFSRPKNEATQKDGNTWEAYNTWVWNSGIAKSIRRSNNFLNDTVAKLVAGNTNKAVVARNIFNYVRSNFAVDKDAEHTEPKIVFEKRGGCAEAINMLLAAMLNKAGLSAYMLMICTTERASATEEVHVNNGFNYLACALSSDTDGRYVLLDATNKFNIFGMLPLEYYNGYSRVITETGDELDLRPQLITNRTINSIKISFPNDSTENFEIYRKIGMVDSRYLRQQMANDNFSKNEYFEKYILKMVDDPKIIESSFDNVETTDTNVIAKVIFQTYIQPEASIHLLNSAYFKTHSTNPFSAPTREFPIEFTSRQNEINQMSIEIPKGYEIDSIPKSRSISTGEGEMEYNKMVTYLADSRVLKIDVANNNDKTVYSNSRYDAIRQHYEAIIKEENKVIELKRK